MRRQPDEIVREADMLERANRLTRAKSAALMAELRATGKAQQRHYDRLQEILARGQPVLKKWARGAPGTRDEE